MTSWSYIWRYAVIWGPSTAAGVWLSYVLREQPTWVHIVGGLVQGLLAIAVSSSWIKRAKRRMKATQKTAELLITEVEVRAIEDAVDEFVERARTDRPAGRFTELAGDRSGQLAPHRPAKWCAWSLQHCAELAVPGDVLGYCLGHRNRVLGASTPDGAR